MPLVMMMAMMMVMVMMMMMERVRMINMVGYVDDDGEGEND